MSQVLTLYTTPVIYLLLDRLLGVMGLIPGMPNVPFLLMGALCGGADGFGCGGVQAYY